MSVRLLSPNPEYSSDSHMCFGLALQEATLRASSEDVISVPRTWEQKNRLDTQQHRSAAQLHVRTTLSSHASSTSEASLCMRQAAHSCKRRISKNRPGVLTQNVNTADGKKMRSRHLLHLCTGIEIDHVAFAKAPGIMDIDNLGMLFGTHQQSFGFRAALLQNACSRSLLLLRDLQSNPIRHDAIYTPIYLL